VFIRLTPKIGSSVPLGKGDSASYTVDYTLYILIVQTNNVVITPYNNRFGGLLKYTSLLTNIYANTYTKLMGVARY